MDYGGGFKLNIFSFSLYGTDQKYLHGIIRNSEFIQNCMPDWNMRVYCGSDVPNYVVKTLLQNGCEVKIWEPSWHDNGMFWRYLPLGEEGIEYLAFRDADSRLNSRDIACLIEWVNSDFPVHIIRDHPFHQTPILGGLWGVRNSQISVVHFWELARDFPNRFGEDQRFLSKFVYPTVSKHALIHDGFFAFETRSKSTIQPSQTFDYMGESYSEDETSDLSLRRIIRRYRESVIFRTRLRCISFLQAKLLLSQSKFVPQRAITIPKR